MFRLLGISKEKAVPPDPTPETEESENVQGTFPAETPKQMAPRKKAARFVGDDFDTITELRDFIIDEKPRIGTARQVVRRMFELLAEEDDE